MTPTDLTENPIFDVECRLCNKGFPLLKMSDGIIRHRGSQSKGMIPDSECARFPYASQPQPPTEPEADEPRCTYKYGNNIAICNRPLRDHEKSNNHKFQPEVREPAKEMTVRAMTWDEQNAELGRLRAQLAARESECEATRGDLLEVWAQLHNLQITLDAKTPPDIQEVRDGIESVMEILDLLANDELPYEEIGDVKAQRDDLADEIETQRATIKEQAARIEEMERNHAGYKREMGAQIERATIESNEEIARLRADVEVWRWSDGKEILKHAETKRRLAGADVEIARLRAEVDDYKEHCLLDAQHPGKHETTRQVWGDGAPPGKYGPPLPNAGTVAEDGGRDAVVGCFDCGLPYGTDDWLDLSLPHDQWAMIAPVNGSGVLCANCIVRRASKLPEIVNVFARFAFRSDHDEIAAQFQLEWIGWHRRRG